MYDLNQKWEEVKSKLYLEIIIQNYNTWIKPLIPLLKKDSTVYLYSTVSFIVYINNERFKPIIEEKFREVLDENVEVKIISSNDPLFESLLKEKENYQKEDSEQMQMGFYKYMDESEKNISKITPQEFGYYESLNKKYTFSNFVRGKSNELALAVALNVAENPASKYNPFFIYGSSGLGKTHIMQAIGHKILENDPTKKIIYITSENFMNEFISSITDSKNSIMNSKKFRDKYRNCDVLMIDDIQFISGKESTQEEIFHTFNSLQANKKQIIFTSDKRPEEIKGLEDRLVSRFSGGMIADIQKPDFETRVAILKHKIKMDRYTIPDNVINFIAENITSNIRNLEGALIKVIAHYNIAKNDRDEFINDEDYLEIAKNALSIIEKKQKPITLDRIKEVVANYYNIEITDMIAKNRQKSISMPRQIAMHLSRKLTNLSLIRIANSFDRDHATVIHGDDKIKLLVEKDVEMKKELENIIAILKRKE